MAWIFNPFTGKLDYYDDTTVAAHHTTHESGGADSIKLDDLASPDDNTDLNFTTSAHGLVPKGTNTGNFLKDDGTWAVPGGGDSDAIHDNVASEISAITEKTTPVDADMMIIEDSAASNAKKMVQLGNLQFNQFVDRGDPATQDFSTVSFTTDDTWHDLDLSSIIPSGAYAVLLRLSIADNLVNADFRLRKNGNSNEDNALIVFTQVADQRKELDVVVAVDSNRKVEYRGKNTTWTRIFITVRGWWI